MFHSIPKFRSKFPRVSFDLGLSTLNPNPPTLQLRVKSFNSAACERNRVAPQRGQCKKFQVMMVGSEVLIFQEPFSCHNKHHSTVPWFKANTQHFAFQTEPSFKRYSFITHLFCLFSFVVTARTFHTYGKLDGSTGILRTKQKHCVATAQCTGMCKHARKIKE